ncbi:phosphate ABC transporter permease subunit PstC [Fodinicola acaciae]|uniref:phosphate ABC transporter permease subunit PstC n=1 Tax=Fodinicola acaciae TaxID=2681555 RepID=UPI0013D7045E|nr:phosphate ABC transporter permease subunit PstC [Fodinicola acaciae]
MPDETKDALSVRLDVTETAADRREVARDIAGDNGVLPVEEHAPQDASALEPAGVRTQAQPVTRTRLADAKSTKLGDSVFRGISTTAGTLILIIMAAIAAFLIYKAIPALAANSSNFFTTTDWFPDANGATGKPSFGIAALTFHTVITSILAMIVAVPIAIGIALFITYYAPRRVAAALGYLVDLLAAVPSVVFGLWGLFFLAPNLRETALFLDRWLGWTVIFDYRPDSVPGNRSDFTAGLVLAIMILPIVSAIAREIFRQVPTSHVEGALALGATRWEMIRLAVLPFGRAGLVSAAMLGLGRALGETLAVATILSAAYNLNVHVLEDGGITFASNIALKYNEAGDVGTGALVASGLCLFVITLLVNSVSQLILRRQAKG